MVMMNSAWNKNNRREIRHTLGRYIAILMIIALGVGFFSGLKVTREAMIRTGDTYIKNSNMYDYRLLSTLGVTKEDAGEISGLEGVQAAEAAVYADFITDYNGHADIILKAHSITEQLNRLNITAGRLPEADNECVVDALAFTEADIGNTIIVSDKNAEDTIESFTYREYTIVGVCNSVNYMYRSDRGTTRLAGGAVAAFVYIPEGGFSFDYYNEIYVTLKNNQGLIFSRDYEAAVSSMEQPLTDAIEKRAELRYQDIVEGANDKIDEAQGEYDESYGEYLDKKAEADTKLQDAWNTLEDARVKIRENEGKLSDGEKKLEEGREEYNSSLADYNSSKALYEAKKKETLHTLETKQQELDNSRTKVTGGLSQIEESGVLEQYNTLTGSQRTLKAALAEVTDTGSLEYRTYEAQLKQVEEGIARIEATGMIEQYQSLTESLSQIDIAQTQLNGSRDMAGSQFAETEKQLASAKAQLDAAKQTIENHRKEIAEGKAALAEAKEEYADGLEEYNETKAETEDSLKEAEDKLADAKEKIEQARADIKELAKPVCYVLDRSKNTGYACFENDSSVVEGIAKVFPFFFFLVAALVCSTTMTRMVDEQRTQIGTLKALGYSNRAIAWRYISYSGSAAILGCILGYAVGTKLFPFAIWQAYKMLYSFAEIRYVFNGVLALLMLLVSLLCSVGATCAASKAELSQMPAALMRPKAPKAGKRIFLEYIPLVWSRVSFLHKVSIRNILRYKKRLFMMVLGTGGCMALLLAGLGLNDSISNIADDQFDTIMMYDYTISFQEAQTEDGMEDFRKDTAGLLSECVFVCTDTYEITGKGGTQRVNVIASDDPDITKVIGLHLNGRTVPFPEDGYVAINDRLAETEGVGIGDTLTLSLNDTQTYQVAIGGIFKNYAYNYMYMSGETYRQVFGKEPSYQTAYGTTDSDQLYDISARLMKDYGASNVYVTADTREHVTNMMESLNYIVWLVIACAGALAFVVMYNLSNINITERNREIATIKVLGFYPMETYSYVFRENMVITLISTVPGLLAGIYLHRFVMEQIKIEAVSFNIRILPMSYVYALLVTFGLTILVNLILARKIEGIHMAESLKSVE
ncbi:MAG TPA: FtsX-like permease family protein [Clostridiales bacterium]|nr:FtsX-like permease family protein [Clostridiales bacterium]